MNDQEIFNLSDAIWGYAETGFTEVKSAKALEDVMRNNDFTVTVGIADMPTAFVAEYGSGRPVISFLAEYDALFGMNQTADCTEFHPITTAEDTGHGCGHELLGAGAAAAAILYKEYLQKTGRSGTVRLYGCPAEESGSGKVYLARGGYFADTDAALTWHPGLFNQVCTASSQSCISMFFKFHGVSSHAAGAPHLGRSALDGCELMNVGVNYLREHMEDSDRVHYAYTNAGGKAPNVVQSEATLKYFIRSKDNPTCLKLMDRVINCAKGAALMTGTTVDVLFDEGLSNTVNNFTLEKLFRDVFLSQPKPEFTQGELAYAQSFKDTYGVDAMIHDLDPLIQNKDEVIENIRKSPLCTIFVDKTCSDQVRMGSTDVGDVSWVVPTATINTACFAYGAGGHSWQWVAQGKSSIAHKAELYAAEILCEAAVRLNEHPEILQAARAEFDKRMDGQKYECLIPDDVKPHVSDL